MAKTEVSSHKAASDEDWSDGEEEEEWESDTERMQEIGDVQLGFVEPFDEEASKSALFLNHYWHDWDGGKVGGMPIWLDPKELPEPRRTRCGNCKDPMTFLLQIYCPHDERETAFHRCLYVFVCPHPQCSNSRSSVTALRCQLPRANPYYAYQPSIKGSCEPLVAGGKSCPRAWGVSICVVCGGRSDSTCARCRTIKYCSKLHQKLHWRAGHKSECKPLTAAESKEKLAPKFVLPSELPSEAIKGGKKGTVGSEIGGVPVGFPSPIPVPVDRDTQPKSAASLGLFPEYEVLIEDEVFDKVRRDKEDEKLMQKFADIQLEDAGPDAGLKQKELDRATGYAKLKGYTGRNDPLTSLFLSRVRESQKQILRYDRGGNPLWCSTKDLPKVSSTIDIPQCTICGEIRTFEFQVMPQLLHFLRVDAGREISGGVHPALAKSLDWGTLAVYTCPYSCGSGGGYREEFVWRQGPLDGTIMDNTPSDEDQSNQTSNGVKLN